MPYIPNSNTRPVEPDGGSILSDINVAEVLLGVARGTTPPCPSRASPPLGS